MDGSQMGGSDFFPPHLSPASFSLQVSSLFYFRFRSAVHVTEHASLIAIISHKEPWWFAVCGLLSHRGPHAAHQYCHGTNRHPSGAPPRGTANLPATRPPGSLQQDTQDIHGSLQPRTDLRAGLGWAGFDWVWGHPPSSLRRQGSTVEGTETPWPWSALRFLSGLGPVAARHLALKPAHSQPETRVAPSPTSPARSLSSPPPTHTVAVSIQRVVRLVVAALCDFDPQMTP